MVLISYVVFLSFDYVICKMGVNGNIDSIEWLEDLEVVKNIILFFRMIGLLYMEFTVVMVVCIRVL